jgi:PAS domain S-box-containing protein
LKNALLVRGLGLGFGIPIAMLLALSVVSYRTVVTSNAGTTWLLHTHQVLEKSSGLLSATQDVETGYRGFALTGDSRSLVPYQDGLARAITGLAAIKMLTADNQSQQIRIARLTTLLGREIQFAGQIVQLRRTAGEHAASARMTEGDDTQLIEDIRNLLHEIQQEETRLLAVREAIADRNFVRTALVMALGIFCAVVVLAVAGWLVGRDTIARWNIEQTLRQSHHDTEVLLNSVPSLLIGLDANGRIQRWNKAATMILGWPEAILPGKTLDECGVKWLTADISSRVAAYVREPAARSLDGVKLDRNGTIRTLGLNAIQFNNEGATGILIIGADITQRIALEEQLRQAQKLESIGQLAAGIAHEINTPTQYIGDNVQFLKDAFQDLKPLLANYDRLLVAAKGGALTGETVGEVSVAVERADLGYLLDEIPKAIEQTLEGVGRVSTLVSAMKDFSHPGTQEKVELDLNRAIESTLTVARNEWKYVADMETDYDPSSPIVSCLPGEFNQAILILIVNAAHAIADVIEKGGPEKGKIKVQTVNCQEWDEVRIEDTGSGIPKDIRGRVFDPFFTTKEIGKGTGQGLAIARSVIVDKHGGTLHFETEEGKGTTFIIRLPRDGKTLTAQLVSPCETHLVGGR